MKNYLFFLQCDQTIVNVTIVINVLIVFTQLLASNVIIVLIVDNVVFVLIVKHLTNV